ncbi:hypothetical protein C7Y47_00480 [Lysinibacillus sphaericus]|uniref:Secreted protein n=1 Tax=Lysinibacillus sphaericus TaxID=1421 RepID=A0A544V0C3_LYSSH|nr:hypothetical protein [Lysinibacillus sp. SDF0037]TQR39549.1 hypothetical protein C7Y47_00480 [Lysinibacillus sp. SDF0037]
MKKFVTIFSLAILIFSVSGFTNLGVANANWDLFQVQIKNGAQNHCSSSGVAFYGIGTDIETENYDTYENYEYVIIEDENTYNNNEEKNKTENSDIQALSTSTYADQSAKSKLGSKIVLPTKYGSDHYGYCHIFKLHMEKSNGDFDRTVKIGGVPKSQFQYAWYPGGTKDIIMDVINGTKELRCTGNTCTKQAKSSSSNGQIVRVVLEKGSAFQSQNYSNYDWVVKSAYPVFD